MTRFLGVLLLLASAANAQERRLTPVIAGPRRTALVIGNNAYPGRALQNAANDAIAMKDTLAGLGFEVTLKLNQGMTQMEESIDRFVGAVRPGDVALFYYAGHGMQVGEQNYLIPVDFDARTAADAKYKSYAAGRVQENLEAAGASLQIFIFDACRDNPYRGLRGGGGLVAMQAGKGTYIAFATAPGKTADDNAASRNGLFTGALVNIILKHPGLTLDQIFNRVRAQVSSVRPEQVPWSTTSVVGDFYFLPGSIPPESTSVPPEISASPGSPVTAPATGASMTLSDANRLYDSNQYSAALAAFFTIAQSGDSEAMSRIGDVFAGGLGVARNFGESLRWYRRAADLGNGRGMHAIGRFYLLGTGVERNVVEAEAWFRRAADAGEIAAMADLKRIAECDFIEINLNRQAGPRTIGDVDLVLKAADPRRQVYTIQVRADDKLTEKKDKRIGEEVQFYTVSGGRTPYSIVITQIQRGVAMGYVAVPKKRDLKR
jgi:hypothetical protein